MKKRSTRRAFGRRALAFGITMFAMITLTTVGFAAWLISTNSTAHAGGNIKTQTVKQANIKITIFNVDEDGNLINKTNGNTPYEIIYAPKANSAGLISFDGSGGDKPESLTFSFNGKVEQAQRVGTLQFSVKVPPAIIAAAGLTKSGETWSYNPANAYIALPEYAVDNDGNPLPKVLNGEWDEVSMTEPITFTNISELSGEGLKSDPVTLTAIDGSNVMNFTGTDIAFGWGARYGLANPADTFNSDDWTKVSHTGVREDQTTTTNQIQLELIKLQSAVNGIALDDTLIGESMEGVTAATIDDYVKTGDQATVQGQLEKLQEKLGEQIEGHRPTYTLFIEAKVRV